MLVQVAGRLCRWAKPNVGCGKAQVLRFARGRSDEWILADEILKLHSEPCMENVELVCQHIGVTRA